MMVRAELKIDLRDPRAKKAHAVFPSGSSVRREDPGEEQGMW